MKKNIFLPLSVGLSILFTACVTSEIEQRTTSVHKIYPNQKHIIVDKNTTITHYTNRFSNRNLGEGHTFTYKFIIKNDAINWNGGAAEPKHIVFCNDTVYLHYVTEKFEADTSAIDSTVSSTQRSGIYKTISVYETFVDKRYFFNLLGEAYWLNISEEIYNFKKTKYKEYDIPNDDELFIHKKD
jgi:hypothetical protein